MRLYLQPYSLLALTQAIIAAFLVAYLLATRQKSRATWMLAFAFGSFTLIWIGAFINLSLPSWNVTIPAMMGTVTLFGFLNFAYVFLGNPFEREARVAFASTAAFTTFVVAFHAACIAQSRSLPSDFVVTQQAANLLFVLWTIVVFLRKLTHGPDCHLWRCLWQPKTSHARAFRAFALLMAGVIPLSVLAVLEASGISTTWTIVSTYVGFMLLLIAFVVVYLNHSPQPTTFLAKLIGLSLATFLVILGIAALMLYPEGKTLRASRTELARPVTSRFVPIGMTGYGVSPMPLLLDRDFGQDLDLGVEGDSLVTLAFPFPFAGKDWVELFVDVNGLVSFGGRYSELQFDSFVTDELPKIAPMYRATIPRAGEGAGVYFRSASDKAVVTWYRVRERYDENPTNENTFQLVLHRDGSIDFVYDRLDALPISGFRGVHLGGQYPPPVITAVPIAQHSELMARLVPEGRTIRFEALPDGTYHSDTTASTYNEDIGEDLQFRNGSRRVVSLGFSFPLGSTRWDSTIVSDNGIVSFGPTLSYAVTDWFTPFHVAYNATPMVAPFFKDLDPGTAGGVYLKRTDNDATITWLDVPEFAHPEANTVQLVLSRNGDVTFTYRKVTGERFAADLWGIYPGPSHGAHNAVAFLSRRARELANPAEAMVLDVGAAATLTYLRYRHDRTVPFVYAILGTTFVVVLVFPFLFRLTLVRPLDALLRGVRRVNAGDLEASVEVHVNDEIGSLAANFNEMTTSLRAAQANLRDYAATLEDKVAERTADLREALSNLTDAQDRLIHAEKMASLGKLTSGIAHEIMNPLNFINNFAEMSVEMAGELASGPPDGDEVGELIADIRSNATAIAEHGKRLRGIVTTMAEHAVVFSGGKSQTDIDRLVGDQIELARFRLASGEPCSNVSVEAELDSAITIDIVPQEIGRVIVNLLNNAIDSVCQRAELASSISYRPIVTVSTRRIPGAVEIRVEDNGAGFSSEISSRIFEPFFTTKPTGTATGLGLSLAHDIVVQGHGGTLKAESQDGEGAAFVVGLPL